MTNLKLLQLLESILGKGKSTSGDNIAFFSPFVSHYKPKLEINIKTTSAGENHWHCWISDKKGRSIHSLFKQLNLPKSKFEKLNNIIEVSVPQYRIDVTRPEDILEEVRNGETLRLLREDIDYPARYVACKGINFARVVARVIFQDAQLRVASMEIIAAALFLDIGMIKIQSSGLGKQLGSAALKFGNFVHCDHWQYGTDFEKAIEDIKGCGFKTNSVINCKYGFLFPREEFCLGCRASKAFTDLESHNIFFETEIHHAFWSKQPKETIKERILTNEELPPVNIDEYIDIVLKKSNY